MKIPFNEKAFLAQLDSEPPYLLVNWGETPAETWKRMQEIEKERAEDAMRVA